MLVQILTNVKAKWSAKSSMYLSLLTVTFFGKTTSFLSPWYPWAPQTMTDLGCLSLLAVSWGVGSLTFPYLYPPSSVASDGKDGLFRPQHILSLVLIPGKVFLAKANSILLLPGCNDRFSSRCAVHKVVEATLNGHQIHIGQQLRVLLFKFVSRNARSIVNLVCRTFKVQHVVFQTHTSLFLGSSGSVSPVSWERLVHLCTDDSWIRWCLKFLCHTFLPLLGQ